MGSACQDQHTISQAPGSGEYLVDIQLIDNTILLTHHQFREENGKKKPVEKRKLEKHYLDFIKLSQRFYRGYIQHLSLHFGGIPEFEQVARKFGFESKDSALVADLDHWC
jgi:hypothetical protein